MKTIFTTISLLFVLMTAKAQITLDHVYGSGNVNSYYTIAPLRIVHFSSLTLGYKYAIGIKKGSNSGTINLYNLNHSLYKSITIPPLTGGINIANVYYISDSLFNTNTSTIEYLISYQDTIGALRLRIFDDLGDTIFSSDSLTLGWVFPTFTYSEPIFYTPGGYKLILQQNTGFDSATFVYSLPGALPCSECANGNIISAIGGGPSNGGGRNSGYLQNPYPNPTSHSTNIKYQLPDGADQGQIVFYNLQGKELKSLTVDRTFDTLNVSTTDLASGTYLYVLKTSQGIVGNKKVVVIRQ
ncbi:MAG TPA: T9SS type A sorting domain-containing protein [Bacteroidia bacterium]|jgi:hypothetical protein|nr:T9SS type A sorting domain-containing protein [Bacteroidia bacterium]